LKLKFSIIWSSREEKKSIPTILELIIKERDKNRQLLIIYYIVNILEEYNYMGESTHLVKKKKKIMYS